MLFIFYVVPVRFGVDVSLPVGTVLCRCTRPCADRRHAGESDPWVLWWVVAPNRRYIWL